MSFNQLVMVLAIMFILSAIIATHATRIQHADMVVESTGQLFK